MFECKRNEALYVWNERMKLNKIKYMYENENEKEKKT